MASNDNERWDDAGKDRRDVLRQLEVMITSQPLLYVFSIHNFKAKYIFLKLFFLVFVGSQIIIFLTPFMDLIFLEVALILLLKMSRVI